MKFYVGQRVRVVNAGRSVHLIGQEARIVRWRDRAYCGKRGVYYTGWQTTLTNVMGRPFVAEVGWLEPILDPGREVIGWEECLWQPEWYKAWNRA